MRAYYNEFDPKPAAWLRELIKEGHIADGDVDERSIADVQPEDLKDYTQCHFFAGIGGWSLALQLAGWNPDVPVWSGSCPCQPLSSAGKREGAEDERHLWPELYRLITECDPPTVFGEQVAAKAGIEWLDGVSLDLEDVGYAVAAADLSAAGVGAPHVRQRIFWVANTEGGRGLEQILKRETKGDIQAGPQFIGRGPSGGLVNTQLRGCRQSIAGNMEGADQGPGAQSTDSRRGFWADSDPIHCRDGKARRVEPGTFPLAHGIPGRVGLLRGYGNAIVPEVAAEFIGAFIEAKTALSA